ncbi:Predicted oxidoreductase [Lentzea xinjiangensis]|uniref:Predicted oxidoreductase n=1 Tax=Lentzea xinjiangensis TaxID=402600 RepID=A0A1H9GWW0_9PSEU|nr:aldo/keto reductase [Lentzea xinjiangensis]SEQ54569.1 Predicted oxidoreductase [Lentzea xinjiangensis]
MQKRQLGATGPVVSAIGLGCMGMSNAYGPADRDESIATVRAAVDAGVTLLDTGDFYGQGHNELLISEAIRGRRDEVLLSVKFGAMRDAEGAFLGFDGRPVAVANSLAYSLQRLGTDHVDVYRPARLDPDVPIEDTIGAIAEQVEKGHVRHIGLSEVGAETIRRAHAVHPIADLQIEYGLLERGVEKEILRTTRELGIGITAYGVLSRGLISATPLAISSGDWRGHTPRFQGDNLRHNAALVEKLGEIARDKGVTVAQLAIAWVAARGEDVVPLVGTSKRARLEEAIGAVDVTFTEQELREIDTVVPVGAAAGTRYPAQQMAMLDSER